MEKNENKLENLPDFDPTENLLQAGRIRGARGLAAKPLMEYEILEAQENARSASEAARILGVSYNTYKKYAVQYGIFENLINKEGFGISKGVKGLNMAKIEDILAGKHPNYPLWKLKKRLLLGGYFPEECAVCGFDERRLTDHRVPLIMDFVDGDVHNHKHENIRMLCYNCHFLLVGNLTGPKREFIY
jgi:hypothetical protein